MPSSLSSLWFCFLFLLQFGFSVCPVFIILFFKFPFRLPLPIYLFCRSIWKCPVFPPFLIQIFFIFALLQTMGLTVVWTTSWRSLFITQCIQHHSPMRPHVRPAAPHPLTTHSAPVHHTPKQWCVKTDQWNRTLTFSRISVIDLRMEVSFWLAHYFGLDWTILRTIRPVDLKFVTDIHVHFTRWNIQIINLLIRFCLVLSQQQKHINKWIYFQETEMNKRLIAVNSSEYHFIFP